MDNCNLTIKSEVLATKVLIEDGKAKGVKYLNGWNIYQTGRQNDQNFGWGGTAGDARANSIIAKEKGERVVYARREVILCGGAYNTAQLLQLSGIGDPEDLVPLGIKVKNNLPGVGHQTVDNHELFLTWKADAGRPQLFLWLAAKSNLQLQNTNFDCAFGTLQNGDNVNQDPFVQQGFISTIGAAAPNQMYGRNEFQKVLVKPDQNPLTDTSPITINVNNTCGAFVEMSENNRTRGSVVIVSKDPTVPPKITYDFLGGTSTPQYPGDTGSDLQDFVDIMMNTIFPMMLSLESSGYYSGLLIPAAYDILKPGYTDFTNANGSVEDQIDIDKLKEYLRLHVGGHHIGGSCKMGVKSDPMAVVDQKGLVFGTKRLRICDMSIVPFSIRWPNGTVCVIAEKIAEDIINCHQ